MQYIYIANDGHTDKIETSVLKGEDVPMCGGEVDYLEFDQNEPDAGNYILVPATQDNIENLKLFVQELQTEHNKEVHRQFTSYKAMMESHRLTEY